MTVEQIKTVEPNQSLVEQCEGLLKDAKSGDIQGIVGVIIYDSGTSSDFWTPPPKSYHPNLVCDRIVGCIERIKYQLLSSRYCVDAEDSWRF